MSALNFELKEIAYKTEPLKEEFPIISEALNFASTHRLREVNLKGLNLSNEELNAFAEKNSFIKILILTSQALTEFPSSFRNLRYLDISYCTHITKLESEMLELKVLIAVGCIRLKILPNKMPNLKELNIAGTSVTLLSDGYDKLRELSLLQEQLNDVLTHPLNEKCKLKVLPN